MDYKRHLAQLLSVLLLTQCLVAPAFSAPPPAAPNPDETAALASVFSELMQMESRQSPLTPSQFTLAATRFIVMLPFLPLLVAVPGATSFLMPMFMALQDRLKTVIPNMATGNRPFSFLNIFGGGSNNNNNQQGAESAPSGTTAEADSPTFFRFKRSVLKAPVKALNEGFREVFDLLHRTDDVLNHLMSSQPDCRRQVVCRMHQAIDPSIGSFIGNMIQVFKLESKVDELDVSSFTKTILKDILKAANVGLFRQDCSSVYGECSLAETAARLLL